MTGQPLDDPYLGTRRGTRASLDPPEADLAAALQGTEEAVVIAGHTHVQFDRRAGRWRFVNVGSVGRPWRCRPGAYWALLGPDVELLRTDYDVHAAAER